MNNFLAMLKDSFREAIDGWIFTAMMILAAIVILFVGSMSVTPVVSDAGLVSMLGSGEQQLLSPDRGQAKKFAIFLFRPKVENLKVTNEERPWAGPLEFEIEFTSSGFGAAGAEVELDEEKKPKVDPKKMQESVMMGDPFREAVRYWASKPGEKKPDYTEELAKEFIASYVTDHTRLNVSEVVSLKKENGGLLGNILGGGSQKFLVKCESGEVVGWAHQPSFLFGLLNPSINRPLGVMINTVEGTMVNTFGAWVLLLAGVIVTAGFIPNMLRKGAIDLLLTKPMSRPAILIYKYLGGMMFVIILTMFTIVGVWTVIGLRTGIWSTGLLWAVGGITAYFAILYGCSTLLGVLTRNSIVSIVGTIVFWFVIWLIGFSNSIVQTLSIMENLPQRPNARQTSRADKPKVKEQDQGKDKEAGQKDAKDNAAEPKPAEESASAPSKIVPDWLSTGMKWLNRVTPRTSDLDTITSELIAKDLLRPSELKQAKLLTKDLDLVEVIAVATAWLGLFLGLALLRFVTRSY